MQHERTQIAFKLIFSHLALIPLVITISFFIRTNTFLIISSIQTGLLILFVSGYWEFFGLKFRTAFFLSTEILLIIELTRNIYSYSAEKSGWIITSLLVVLQVYLLYELVKALITVYKHEKQSLQIEFPFKEGRYLVTDGGNSKISRLMNYHFFSEIHKKNKTNYSMLFATDIIKLNNKPGKFMPLQNEEYPIFGENVYSPIDGVVLKVVNDIEDNRTYAGNYPYNTGNTVVIRKDDKYLLLGHLKRGSIKVKTGEIVQKKQLLAEAGNSGYSERPHIHIQLIRCDTEYFWKGIGLSMEFSGKNLFKNRVISV